MALLAQYPKFQAFDSNGDPLAGGQLYTYLAGTTTKKATFTDASGGAANTNPVILNGRGEADVWLGGGAYKFVLKDQLGADIWSVDNITAQGTGDSGSGASAWITHAITNGQSATDLDGETVDSASSSSADYDFEIKRGTTVFANGKFSLQFLNGSWRIQLGEYRSDIGHGVTFSLSGTTTAQLRAAADSGAGDGTIKLSRKLIPT